MRASESTPKRGSYKKIVVLFLPKELATRLTLIGIILILVGFNVSGVTLVPLVFIALGLFAWALVVTVRNGLKRKGHRISRFIRTITKVVGVTIAYIAAFFVFGTLGFEAGGGNARFSSVISSSSSQGTLGSVEAYLVIATIVLLVWIPQVFFSIQLDISGTGDAQRLLLGLITAASCATTGTIILLYHFGDGPLRNVNMGTLVIGIIGTVLLVAHPFRSLARVCWQRGIAGIFSLRTLKQHWGNMATELAKALDRTAEHDATRSSAASPATEKQA